jgi:hypothetical protein
MSLFILNTNIHSQNIEKSLKLSKVTFVNTQQKILNGIVAKEFLDDLYEREWPRSSFSIRSNCIVFDNEDENKLEYTSIHNVRLYLSVLYCVAIQEDSR